MTPCGVKATGTRARACPRIAMLTATAATRDAVPTATPTMIATEDDAAAASLVTCMLLIRSVALVGVVSLVETRPAVLSRGVRVRSTALERVSDGTRALTLASSTSCVAMA